MRAQASADPKIPSDLVRYLPTGHRVWYQRHLGAMRRPALLCVCGNRRDVETIKTKLAGGGAMDEPLPVTDEDWLELVNQCRIAIHSTQRPCPPMTREGVEQPMRESPLAAIPVTLDQPKRKENTHA